MKAYIIFDKEFRTNIFDDIYKCTREYLTDKGYDIAETGIGKGELAYCMGCFGCWIKKPGECVIPDLMKEINDTYMNSDIVVYLCPIVFGEFSANMKNALDRWIPNILPFFVVRKDSSTTHTSRYASYPKQIMLGYSDSLVGEDAKLFEDITKKHRRSIEVIIYGNSTEDLKTNLNKIELGRVGGSL
jgi:multimeric flavodoxin WrbA